MQKGSVVAVLLLGGAIVAGCSSTPSVPSTAIGAQASLKLSTSLISDQQTDVRADVLDANGHGVPNVAVQFSVDAGTVTPATVTTDANGTAHTTAAVSGLSVVHATTGALSSNMAISGNVPLFTVTLAVPSVTAGTASTLTATVSGTALAGGFTYTWSFGDGTNAITSANSTTHQYASSGTYTASVKVTDGANRGVFAVVATTITPAATAPSSPTIPIPTFTPTLSASLTCTASAHGTPSQCNVAATYTTASGTVNIASNNITSVAWDWGDGTTQTIANSPLGTHTYAQTGTYIVTATVTATTADGNKTASAVTKTLSIN